MFLKAACPDHKDGAIINLFKLYSNMGGSGLLPEATSFTNDEVVNMIKKMLDGSEFATWIMLKNIPRKEVKM
eukprot:8974423-Karenia_brevis.AAC.1